MKPIKKLNESMKRLIPYLVIGLFLAGFYFFRYRRAPEMDLTQIAIVNENGEKTTVANMLGEYSTVHYYASWCGPCIDEMRRIRNNFEMLQTYGIKFIFITDDSEDQIQRTREFMPKEISFFRINSLHEAGIYTLPTTYILKGTTVLEKHVEALGWDKEEEIKKIFTINKEN